MTEQTGAERRKFIRVRKVVPIHLEKEKIEGTLFSVDISGGGLRIVTPAPLETGKEVTMKIYFERFLAPVLITGRIVWGKQLSVPGKYEAGVQFLEVTGEGREKILAVIQRALAEDKKR